MAFLQQPIWGIILAIAVTILSLVGIPIAAAMGFIATVYTWAVFADLRGLYDCGLNGWDNMTSYTMSMVALFVMMGALVSKSGIGADMFDSFYKWLGKLKGGLAMAATVASAFFGAITGSTPATIAAIGGISYPEMRKRGYSVRLAMGSIACAGVLANLIPPTIIGLVYCMLVDVSVIDVFMAGLIPGVILTIMYCISIYVWVWLKPKEAPKMVESYTFKEKLIAVKGPLPIVAIFILMFGGIYIGIFSPTEAGAVGVTCTLLVIIALRRLNRNVIKGTMYETVRITTFVMTLLFGAFGLLTALALSQFPDALASWIQGLALSPLAVMFMIILVIILLGLPLDGMSIMVLFTPVFFKTVVAIGYSPIWFGTLNVMLAEIASISPPVAANLMVTQQLDPSAPENEGTKGIIPFYTASLALVVLLVFFPQIATWLPNTMYH